MSEEEEQHWGAGGDIDALGAVGFGPQAPAAAAAAAAVPAAAAGPAAPQGAGEGGGEGDGEGDGGDEEWQPGGDASAY